MRRGPTRWRRRSIGREAAVQAVPLARRAVERVTSALLYLDDSSGVMGDRLGELMLQYAKACTAAPPGRQAARCVAGEDAAGRAGLAGYLAG
jgi:hypothetical protein